jgi:hypothetical protein
MEIIPYHYKANVYFTYVIGIVIMYHTNRSQSLHIDLFWGLLMKDDTTHNLTCKQSIFMAKVLLYFKEKPSNNFSLVNYIKEWSKILSIVCLSNEETGRK